MMQPQQDGPLKPIVSLIGNPTVQRELDLVGPQLKGIKEALEGVRDAFRPRIEALQRLPEAKKLEARPALMRELIAHAEATLAKVLRPDQLRRFLQLRLQGEGISAFLKEPVRAQLALSDEQGRAIKELVHDGMRRIEGLRGSRAGGARERIAEIREEVTDRIRALLSAEQQASWEQLLGEPLALGTTEPAPAAAPRAAGSRGPGSSGPGTAGPGAGNDPFAWR